MKYNADALDFLLPGVMSLAQVQSRRVIFDKSYDLEVPYGQIGEVHKPAVDFWGTIEADLMEAKVGNFQTVELTMSFVRPQCKGPLALPVVTTCRMMYLPIMHKCWSEYEPFTGHSDDYEFPTYIFFNALDLGRLKRVIVRLQPDLSMPIYWTEQPHLDFPLFEKGFVPPPATLLENMESASNSSASFKSDRFTADDVELLEKELDPTSRVLLKPMEYTQRIGDDGVTLEQYGEGEINNTIKQNQLTSFIANKIPDRSRVARITEVITEAHKRCIVRLDYPLVADHDVSVPSSEFHVYDESCDRKFFVYQDDRSIDLLEKVFGDQNHIP